VTVEGYYSEVIPMDCFDETSDGWYWHPVREYKIDGLTPNGYINYVWMVNED